MRKERCREKHATLIRCENIVFYEEPTMRQFVKTHVVAVIFGKEGEIMGIIKYIKEEMEVIKERDPAIKTSKEVFLYPTFKAILRYRLAHKLYLKKHYFLAR